MNVTVPDQRLAQNIASTLRWTCLDENGTEVPAAAPPTVTVTRSDGTAIITDQAMTLDVTTEGTYTRLLTVAQMATLDLLTATWKVNGVLVATTRIEVVGRLAFTIAEARGIRELEDETEFSIADLAFYRLVTEREAEWICGLSFTPSFRRITLDGSGEVSLVVPDAEIRSVESCTQDGTALTSTQLGQLQRYDYRIDTTVGDIWSTGQRNITIAYIHGLDTWPPEVKAAALVRLREHATANGPGARSVTARATSMTTDTTTVDLSMAGEFSTGNPEVDAVYQRWSKRTSSGADGEGGPAPYARNLDFNPQYLSLFHGGIR